MPCAPWSGALWRFPGRKGAKLSFNAYILRTLLVVTSNQPDPLPLLRPFVVTLSLKAAKKTTLWIGSEIWATNTSELNLSCRSRKGSEGSCGLPALAYTTDYDVLFPPDVGGYLLSCGETASKIHLWSNVSASTAGNVAWKMRSLTRRGRELFHNSLCLVYACSAKAARACGVAL